MPKYLLGLFCSLGLVLNSFGQILTPLDSYILQHTASDSGKRNARTHAVGDTLALPFFEDFAGYTGQPDARYWQSGGGVYVNNQFGVNPPSLHVATFEGVNAAGLPYTNLVTYGYTDSLTSKPILLKGLNPATDSVYISFYWQAGGLGGSPDNNTDSKPTFLELEFKDVNENWQSVWRQPGESQKTAFTRVVLPITNPTYFHPGFQFRFRSSGIRRGTGDTWNLDYIYLNKKRNPNRSDLPDVAISQQLNSLLERYTAMPANQFLVRPAQEVSDSAFTRLNNLNNLFAPITWRGYVQTLQPAAPADTFLRGNAAIAPLNVQYLILGTPKAAGIPNTGTEFRVKHSLFLSTRETDARLRQNDTVSRITVLSDYYAYDDGTAETNFSLNNSGARQLAYQFQANVPVMVRAIRVFLTKTNVPGTVMNFRLWKGANGSPAGTALAQRSFTIPPVDSLNRFYEIAFTTPVAVADTFFIGYSLTSAVNDFVNIGFDLNEEAPGYIHYNNGNGWLTFTEERGALLLRAVTGDTTTIPDDPDDPNEPINPVEPDEDTIVIYPNPSNGIFRIKGNYQDLCLLDVAGKIIVCKTKAEAGDNLDLRNLAKGMYLLQLNQENRTVVRKLILTK